ncbi:hypothetical protein HDV00_003126 [Rhizophlyctis rosea]|nr:hypothetical protein HDV00_003126 [Rhizophlyctis rosea]
MNSRADPTQFQNDLSLLRTRKEQVTAAKAANQATKKARISWPKEANDILLALKHQHTSNTALNDTGSGSHAGNPFTSKKRKRTPHQGTDIDARTIATSYVVDYLLPGAAFNPTVEQTISHLRELERDRKTKAA